MQFTRRAEVGGAEGAAYDFRLESDGLMVIRWNRTATADESAVLMSRIEALWERGTRYAVAMITHPDVNADARHRKIWGEWHERNRAEVARYCAGMSITVDSAAIRALMTAISWFSKDTYPIKYVRTEAEALAWARGRLRGG